MSFVLCLVVMLSAVSVQAKDYEIVEAQKGGDFIVKFTPSEPVSDCFVHYVIKSDNFTNSYTGIVSRTEDGFESMTTLPDGEHVYVMITVSFRKLDGSYTREVINYKA